MNPSSISSTPRLQVRTSSSSGSVRPTPGGGSVRLAGVRSYKCLRAEDSLEPTRPYGSRRHPRGRRQSESSGREAPLRNYRTPEFVWKGYSFSLARPRQILSASFFGLLWEMTRNRTTVMRSELWNLFGTTLLSP